MMSKLRRCVIHKIRLAYNSEFDCYYCSKCNDWKEPKCSDLECHFCTKRPEKPLSDEKFAANLEKVLKKRENMLRNLADR